MQFRHPELLYTLFVLLIPVLIHLFQLQRFVKTPFTNVQLLQKIELQTRKSSQLKKWLILSLRLLAFTAIIVAFAQPYYSKNDATKTWNTTIYIDNSLSLKAKGENGELLKRAIQDITENLPEKGNYNLITNNYLEKNLTKNVFVKKIRDITYSIDKMDYKTLFIKLKQLKKNPSDNYNKTLLISDFQKNTTNFNFEKEAFYAVQLQAKLKHNISIDSIFISKGNLTENVLQIILKNQGEKAENIVLSAYDKQIILAKNMVSIEKNSHSLIELRLPKKNTDIQLKITHPDTYEFDNNYFISFHKPHKANILILEKKATNFLDKIFTPDEFNLTKKLPKELQFSLIKQQDIIVINALKNIPNTLQNALNNYVKKGGNLVIIPNMDSDINSFNPFFSLLDIGSFTSKQSDSIQVTKIHYGHPVFQNVFEKKISNFQYPTLVKHFEGSFPKAKNILSFSNMQSFINSNQVQKGKVFLVTASLERENGNFTNSPLIVPIFYNIGRQSIQNTTLSYRLGEEHLITVKTSLQKDEVLHIKGKNIDYIPKQEIFSDKVVLYTDNNLQNAGFYKIQYKDIPIDNVAFNFPKEESNLSFYDIKSLSKKNTNIRLFNKVKDSIQTLTAEQEITTYFKWFILLALLFLVIESLILKFL